MHVKASTSHLREASSTKTQAHKAEQTQQTEQALPTSTVSVVKDVVAHEPVEQATQQLKDARALTNVTGTPAPSSTKSVAQPGSIALRDPIATHRVQLRADLKLAMDTLVGLPPALTFFGGARIKPEDPYYKISQDIGRLLAEKGVPPRTGAGPGIMQSVPEGYVNRRTQLEALGTTTGPSSQLRQIGGVADGASLDDVRTQGFNIKLPHEQKLNPVIEVAQEIQLFPFRKLALYENARGVVTFPGGFGTIDELFEIWNLAATGKLTDPIAAVGVEFWRPTLEALHKVAVTDRSLISADDAARLFVSDDAHALLDHMLTSEPNPKGFESDPTKLSRTLLKEVDVVTKGLRALAPAVAFIGGETLKDDDPALAVAKGLAGHIASQGAAVRVGDEGAGASAALNAAKAAGATAKNAQAVLWDKGGTEPGTLTSSSTQTGAVLTERIPHKELFLRSAEAYVCLPSGLQGLDEFATVLCQIQNDKLPKRPIILVGGDYWQPILDAWQKTMLSEDRQLISPEDMNLVTVVNTVDEAKAALTNLR